MYWMHIEGDTSIAINPNSVTCTNFLMGGQYYPGKDKQRLHNRRRTLWYRIFFSSSYRRGLSVLVLAYILLFYILNPGFNMVLHYGKILARHPGPGNMDVDGITEPVLLGATKTNYICRWYTTSDPPHKRYFVNTIIGCYNKFWSMLQQYPNFLSKFKR